LGPLLITKPGGSTQDILAHVDQLLVILSTGFCPQSSLSDHLMYASQSRINMEEFSKQKQKDQYGGKKKALLRIEFLSNLSLQLYCFPTELKNCPFSLLSRVSIHGWLYNKQRETPMITK